MRSVIAMFFYLSLQSCMVPAVSAGTNPPPKVFDVSLKNLAANKTRLSRKDVELMPAYEQLLKDADKALQYGPVSVMDKSGTPPSGDKHDYMSLAPYFWPDPTKPDGIPYIRKDGQVNPEVKQYQDKEHLPVLCGNIYTLALAYYFSSEEKYASYAARLIRAWYLDPATRMNPNLNFGQAVKGQNNGRAAGLIETRHIIKVIDAVGLISSSKSWVNADQQGMEAWIASFLNWMQTSKIGQDEWKAANNHGTWYDAQRLSMALFIDSVELAKRVIENAVKRLDTQMDSRGQFPEELERTTSLHYTAFVMNAFFSIARQAETVGVDFWNLKTVSGKSLGLAFKDLHPYILSPGKWTGQQIKTFDPEDGFSILLDASERLGCETCKQEYVTLAGARKGQLRLNLLYQ